MGYFTSFRFISRSASEYGAISKLKQSPFIFPRYFFLADESEMRDISHDLPKKLQFQCGLPVSTAVVNSCL